VLKTFDWFSSGIEPRIFSRSAEADCTTFRNKLLQFNYSAQCFRGNTRHRKGAEGTVAR